MKDSIRLGHISGVPLGLHWSLLVFGGIAVWNLAVGLLPLAAPGYGTAVTFIAAVVAVMALFASILAHELGHAVTARRHGVEVDGITLWMLGGVARLRTEPTSARAAGEIAAAGPVVSVGLGALMGAVAVALSALGFGALTVAVFGYIAIINIVLALFNLIPALPLDGGRLYQAWLWHRVGDPHRATIRAAGLGRLMGWALVGLGLVQVLAVGPAGFWLVLVGSFVVSMAGAERRRARSQLQAVRLQRLWFDPRIAGPVIDVGSRPVE